MNEENKNARIAYINQSQSGDGSVYGKMMWDGKTLRIRNIEEDPKDQQKFCGDVLEETDETYTDKTGTVRNRWKAVGAIRWNTGAGTGDYVTEMDGILVKYALTTTVEEGRFGPTRVLRFKQPSTNSFRSKFEEASEVIAEEPEVPGINDTVPF